MIEVVLFIVFTIVAPTAFLGGLVGYAIGHKDGRMVGHNNLHDVLFKSKGLKGKESRHQSRQNGAI